MSQPTEPDRPAEPGQEPAADPTTATADTDWQAEAEKWKALARKHESRAKANNAAIEEQRAALAALAKHLGVDLGEKPDPAVLAERLEQTRREAASAAIELRVYKLASKLGVDADALLDSRSFCEAIDALNVDDLDAFDAQVTELIKQRSAASATTGRRPVESLRPGALPAGEPTSVDMNDLMRRMASRT